jgi:uridine kinase
MPGDGTAATGASCSAVHGVSIALGDHDLRLDDGAGGDVISAMSEGSGVLNLDAAGNRPSADGAAAIVAEGRSRMRARRAARPFLIALDGASGAGKSTVAGLVARELDAAIVPSDDFFAAGITDSGWAALDARGRAAAAIDWRRLRRDALEPLLAGKVAAWYPFDFASGIRSDGTYPMAAEAVVLAPRDMIVVEGAYSCRPELADLIDLAVLVVASPAERHRRIAARETDEDWTAAWHARWDAAEAFYFTAIRPGSSFDLVVRSDGSDDPGSR